MIPDQRIFIPGRFPSFNELIAVSKKRFHGQASVYAITKRQEGERALRFIQAQRLQPLSGKVFIRFIWVERNRRRDPDNVAAGGRKILLDALVYAGILQNDTWQYIHGWSDIFLVDKEREGVELVLIDV